MTIHNYVDQYGAIARISAQACESVRQADSPTAMATAVQEASKARLLSAWSAFPTTVWAVLGTPRSVLKAISLVALQPDTRGCVQLVCVVALSVARLATQLLTAVAGTLLPEVTYGVLQADKVILLLGLMKRTEETRLPRAAQGSILQEQVNRWKIALAIRDRVVADFASSRTRGFPNYFQGAIGTCFPDAQA